jgi:hypothetical protein
MVMFSPAIASCEAKHERLRGHSRMSEILQTAENHLRVKDFNTIATAKKDFNTIDTPKKDFNTTADPAHRLLKTDRLLRIYFHVSHALSFVVT